MEKIYLDLTAIVAGSVRQHLIDETIAYFNKNNIPCTICEDIYSVAAAIATAPAGASLVVVGNFTTLMAEDMRLFSLIPKDKKVFFCCILKKWLEPLQAKLIGAVKAGAFIVNSADQIDDVIKQCSNGSTKQKISGKGFAARIASLADNFFLSKAEQDALFGVEHDTTTKNRVFAEK